jgi:GT2 family glycosyltransferase
MRDDAGTVLEAPAPPAVGDPLTVRSAVLAELARERRLDPDLMDRHYEPLLSAVQERLNQPLEAADVLQYGSPPADPRVSVIVPLYGRIHFLEQQLAQFTSDPEIRGSDLVYVLDSPELAEELRGLAGHLFTIYGVPFRVAILPRNGGFAAANNLGVSLARAPLVLLLNSDVLPAGPGWLERMAAFHRSTPGIGALAPKLLFEDDSLQHAGLYFRPTEDSGVWENLHFYKGLHRDVPAANVTRRVPAVTAACLMIDRDLYRSIGGLRSIYIQGDYEDSDLCLRLAEAGYDVWYLADVELYHLEGQSYPAPLRAASSRYNRWLHSRLWGPTIARLMETNGSAPVRAAAPAVEILELAAPPSSADVRVQVDAPAPGELAEGFSFDLSGWALGRESPIKALELRHRRAVFRRVPVNQPRPDVAAAFPSTPASAQCGFAASVNLLGLPPDFELSLVAQLENGAAKPAGGIRGRRRPLAPPAGRQVQPLLITTYGRTGSTHLVRLLGAHPAILSYGTFAFEPRLTAYWTQVLRRLSDPASFSTTLGAVLSSSEWWLGNEDPAPLHPAEPPIRDWTERASIESLADFCRQRVQEFYRRVAQVQRRDGARFFVEKNPLNFFSRTLTFELFPGAREIFLVRDLRDMICSIFAHNERTGQPGFGREHVRSDEEFVLWIRAAAEEMLAARRERAREALLVRYEDLITAAPDTLERILSFLEVEADAATCRLIAGSGRSADPIERHHMTSDTAESSVGRWRRDLSPRMQEACNEAFRELLPAFGYHD